VVKIDIATVAKKRAQSAHGTVEPHACVSFTLDVEGPPPGKASCQPSQTDGCYRAQRAEINLRIDSD
jgi:hypothetical protein